MTLKHFIIHGIAKAQGTNAATLNARPDELPLDDKAVRFAETAFRLFHRQSKGLLFAGFGSGGAKEIFQGYLSQYRTQKTVDFLQFSKLSAQHLADTMQPVNLASGGYLIVAEAEIDGEDQLCLLLLSQEHHFAVDEKKLTLLDVPALNLERMGVGCFISITGWRRKPSRSRMSGATGRSPNTSCGSWGRSRQNLRRTLRGTSPPIPRIF